MSKRHIKVRLKIQFDFMEGDDPKTIELLWEQRLRRVIADRQMGQVVACEIDINPDAEPRPYGVEIPADAVGSHNWGKDIEECLSCIPEACRKCRGCGYVRPENFNVQCMGRLYRNEDHTTPDDGRQAVREGNAMPDVQFSNPRWKSPGG